MKKIIVSLLTLVGILLPCHRVLAYCHGNAYGGYSSHSYGQSSHSNTYGGSTSHTAGEGTTHTSAYGTDTSHSAGGGTTHNNAYGGSTSGAYGEGATHNNAYGGSTSGAYGEGATHNNVYGGSTSGAYGEGATHTNPYGGTTSAAYGEGAYHTNSYGTTTAYQSGGYYGYHPPTTVNYYGASCANVNGWATAAAVTTTAAVATASRAVLTTDDAAATSNAYNAGYNAAATNQQPVPPPQPQVPPPVTYTMGQTVSALPASGVTSTANVQGSTYYLCGTTWFYPAFGANGVYYRVVPPPTFQPPPQAGERIMAIMQQLNLAPQQEIAVVPILKVELPKLEAIKNNSSLSQLQKLEQLIAIQDENAPQLQNILSPEQYSALQSILKANLQKAIEAQLNGM